MTREFRALATIDGKTQWHPVHLGHDPEPCCGPSVQDELTDELMRTYGEPVQVLDYRPVQRTRFPGLKFVQVVDADQCYGGPEEGGWWFTSYHLRREWALPVTKAHKIRDRLERSIARKDLHILISDTPFVPRGRPHYC